ncbi:unnamed protein product [Pylaiella littoralis]
MWGESGSEAEVEVPKSKRTTKKAAAGSSKNSKAAANGGGGGKAGSASSTSTSTSRPAAAAGPSKKVKPAAAGTRKKKPSVSPLWTAFLKSRDGVERLGFTPLKKWESFVEEDISVAFLNWYKDQVLGTKSVPQALRIAGLPDGFPEFCHWVAAGHHNACEGTHLKVGFEPFAVEHVKKVEAESRPVGRTSPPPTAAVGVSTSGSGRGTTAPVSEVGGFVAYSAAALEGLHCHNIGPKARKRDRRARKGGAVANGTTYFALKMQSAITELEGMYDRKDESSKSAVARAVGIGHRAEDEIRELMRGDNDTNPDETAGEVLGAAFADSRLPNGTLAMLSHLKRARAYRRRAERQQECIENELERCLGRLARVEAQYLSLIAETNGQESSLASCLARARPLIEAGFVLIEKGSMAQARGNYDDAIKLLEVHVNRAAAGGAADSSEIKAARELLGTALCNRSVACYRLGDAYSGKRDAERAVEDCPGPMAQEQLKRSQTAQQALKAAAASSLQMSAFSSSP